jgi:arylsulfatase A-like enzyme
MRFRESIFIVVVCLICVGCISAVQQASTSTTLAIKKEKSSLDYKCPDCNVLLLTMETFRADHVTALGYQRNITPRLDEFGRENIFFENAVVQAPWTLPSLATILTSTYPSEHGVVGPYTALNESLTTLAEILKDREFNTYYNFVAWFPLEDLNFGQGFDERGPGGTAKSLKGQTTYLLKTRLKGKRFFIWIHYDEPHKPYRPPPPYDSLFIKNIPAEWRDTNRYHCVSRNYTPAEQEIELALYDGEIAFMDEGIGELVDGLKDLGLFNKTIIVILGDHGEEFRDHGGCDHGHTHYEEVIHVPMYMSIPNLNGGGRITTQVRSIDVMPTILDVLDIPFNDTRGVSLIPVINGRFKEDLISYSDSVHPHYAKESMAVRFKDHKLIYSPNQTWKGDKYSEEWEFYDLKNDPLELNNIYGSGAGIEAELRDILTDFMSGNWTRYTPSIIEYSSEAEKRLRDIGYIL